MSLDLFQELTKSRFLLILLEEEEYPQKLEEIMKSVEKTGTRICYVCLSKPYADVANDLGSMGMRVDDFFFIDVLSSHYGTPEPASNVIFVSSPADLGEIGEAVKSAVEEGHCSAVVFDTISTLLIYQQTSSIVRFTNSIVSEKKQENIKKLFIILKGGDVPPDDVNSLAKDLELFADKKLDLTGDRRDINTRANE